MATLTLLTDVSANGNGTAVNTPGGTLTFSAFGTWDGATVTLQYSPDAGTTWMAVGSDTTMTADGVANVRLPPGTPMRCVVSGVGTTSVSANAKG